jgi:hypothetical protein
MIRTDLAARFPRPQEANTRPRTRSRPQLPETRADHQIGDPRRLGRGQPAESNGIKGPNQLPTGCGAGGDAELRRAAARGEGSGGVSVRGPCGDADAAMRLELGPVGVPDCRSLGLSH